MRILGAHIDVALVRPHSKARDGHAFDQHEGIIFHDHAVGESTRIAFIGIADDVLLTRRAFAYGFPFDSGREGCTTATAQAGIRDCFDDLFFAEFQCILETDIAFMRKVVIQRHRIGNTYTRKGQAFLIFQVGNLICLAQGQRVRLAFGEAGIKQ